MLSKKKREADSESVSGNESKYAYAVLLKKVLRMKKNKKVLRRSGIHAVKGTNGR